MTKLTTLGAALVLLASAMPASADVNVTLKDGRVTIIAENATPRQIVTEWGRVGQVKIVGAERVPGMPISIRLVDVPEAQALQVILRSAAGYMAAPRAAAANDASLYDRLLVLPVSTATAAAAPPRPMPEVVTNQPLAIVDPSDGESIDQPVPDAPLDMGLDSDEPQPAGPVAPNPYVSSQPSETNFDYSNPQQLMQRRLEQQQQMENQQAPALFPGTIAAPSTPQGGVAMPGAATTPGQVIQPPSAPTTNPYGIQTQPGAAQEPDRSKYQNPYQTSPQ